MIEPPSPRLLLDYPATIGAAFAILFTSMLLYVAGRFDPTKGTLTISLLVVLAFLGAATMSVLIPMPQDATSSAILGGLVAAFGAVVAYWLGGHSHLPPPPPPPP